MTRIGIRTDANGIIATGHVMRCLAIADALREIGEVPVFITADDSPRVLIQKKGYECISLKSDWQCMNGELENLEQIIKANGIEVLLVDSYFVTKAYFEKLHNLVKTMYIEDLVKEIYDVTAVVCYAGYYEELALEKRYPSQVKLLLGMDYTPLRTVFSRLPEKKISPEIREMVVLSGGTDKYGFLRRFSLFILETPFFKTLETIHVICGKYYGEYEELVREFEGSRKLYFHKEVDNIERYMLSADVAVSAAGVTIYELCAAGVPAIIYTMADNQQKNAEFFMKNGLMEYAGDLRCDPVVERILVLLQGRHQDLRYRRELSESMKNAVDGKGAWRIAEELCRM